MANDDFFAELTPEVTNILGSAVMQILADEEEVSKESIADMIEVLYFDDLEDLAVQLALDALRLK